MSYVGKITDTAGNTGLVGSTLYGTCATAAATAAKVVTCTDFDQLLTGVTIHVKFTYTNTAATPTLNVNGTGAKSIFKYGTTKPGTTVHTSWNAGSVVSFTYDGSYWQMNDHIDNTDTDTHRPIQVNGTQILASNTTALNLAAGSNVSLSNSGGTVTIAATDTTYQSKAAVSGGTDLSLVTTGEKYEWDNADTTVDQILSSDTVSHPILMSSAPYSGTGSDVVDYQGDVLRNNNVYCNPSTGTINTPGWLVCGNNTKTDATQVSVESQIGKIGLVTPSRTDDNNEIMGVTTTDRGDNSAHFIIHRACGGTATSAVTPGTYISGYNYNNQWESFLVQGRDQHYWGVIPAIQSSNGVMEVGAILDFHTSSTGTNDYNYRLRCTGEGAMTYSGTWTKASSRKIKENIEDMDLDEAKEIFNLRPVKFDYKEGFGQKDQRGLIAEEVAEVLPKLVVAEVGEEGTEDWCPASVDYIGVVPYLIKIVQEQQKEIDELKAKVG